VILDKYIFIKRKALSKDLCKNIIDLFERSESDNNPRGYQGVYVDADIPELSFLSGILLPNINEYANQHDFLHRLYIPWGVTPRIFLQKYDPGKSYSGEHMEHGVEDYDCKRLLGWMFYLNDIKKDGGTRWPQQNFTTKPRAGDLYIWPAGWTHSHHGIPAPNETKYIMTGWCAGRNVDE